MSARFEFRGRLWRYPGAAGWYFVTVPKTLSRQMRALSQGLFNSFGSFRVTANVGKTDWRTSAFWDSKADAFLLPVKADVRRREKINAGDAILISLEIEL